MFFFFKHKTAYEMRISDWSLDVCSSDLGCRAGEFMNGLWGRSRRLYGRRMPDSRALPARTSMPLWEQLRPRAFPCRPSWVGARGRSSSHEESRESSTAWLTDRKSTRLNSSH